MICAGSTDLTLITSEPDAYLCRDCAVIIELELMLYRELGAVRA